MVTVHFRYRAQNSGIFSQRISRCRRTWAFSKKGSNRTYLQERSHRLMVEFVQRLERLYVDWIRRFIRNILLSSLSLLEPPILFQTSIPEKTELQERKNTNLWMCMKEDYLWLVEPDRLMYNLVYDNINGRGDTQKINICSAHSPASDSYDLLDGWGHRWWEKARKTNKYWSMITQLLVKCDDNDATLIGSYDAGTLTLHFFSKFHFSMTLCTRISHKCKLLHIIINYVIIFTWTSFKYSRLRI